MWYPGEGLTAEGGTLEVRALCKAFDGRTVLSEVSFRLEPGDCLGVVGVNGSGKSTLLRLLARAERPDSGTILFQDRDRSGDRGFLRRGVGYLPQDNELAEELTVAQQLDLWRAACGLRAGPSPALSALMGLEPMLRRPIHQLSGGMRRRVSIAMALMAEPRILLMDEATVGLDADYREALLCWMEEFLARGGIALWCTHQREELERLCTRCLCLQDGRPRWGDQ